MALIGRYQIARELGRGGMATVYLAFDPRFDRHVAIKVLPREFLHDTTFRARFEREAKLIAALEDLAIVPVYDFGEEAGQPYLVMRYMAGGSLGDRLQRGPLSLGEASMLLACIAPALDKAHRSGVVHRDLKPANILFDRDGNPYIADFGIAKLLASSTSFTSTGIVGTPAYMSPEQVEGESMLDGRSDVYSMGVILYEMLASKPPYNADTPMSVALMHVRKPVPHVRDAAPTLPVAVDQVVATALAKDRAQRYATAGALAAALAQATGGATPPTVFVPSLRPMQSLLATPQPPAPSHLPSQPTRQPRWSALISGLVGLLIAVVLLIVVTFDNSRNGRPLPGTLGVAALPPTDSSTVTLPTSDASSQPTDTSALSTDAPVTSTHTPLLPDETSVSPVDTPVPPTVTPIPPMATAVLPTNTSIPPTQTPRSDAEVNTQNANLRAGPGAAYATLGSYPQGTALTVTGRNNTADWLQVQAPDGKTGWMTRSLLRVNIVLDEVDMATVLPPPTPLVVPTATPDTGRAQVAIPPSLGEKSWVSPSGSLVAVYWRNDDWDGMRHYEEVRTYTVGSWSIPISVCKPYTLGDGVPGEYRIDFLSWAPDESMIAVRGDGPGNGTGAIFICRVSDGSVSYFGIEAGVWGSGNTLVEWSKADGFIYFWSASGANHGKFYSLYKALPDGGIPTVIRSCPEALPGEPAHFC